MYRNRADLNELTFHLDRMPVAEGEETEIPADTLPSLPDIALTASIVVKKRYHHYDDFYRAESLEFFLTRPDAQRLGLSFLCVAMCDQVFNLEFAHPQSQVRSLHVLRPRSVIRSLGLRYVGTSFKYSPKAVRSLTSDAKPDDKPVFKLGSKNPRVRSSEWDKRDAVKLETSDIGLLCLVQMLLDLGTHTRSAELELTSLGGGSVGPGSTEVRFWLPDSIAWTEHTSEN
jgi:hypothetical protein